jgi:hypothetical protein
MKPPRVICSPHSPSREAGVRHVAKFATSMKTLQPIATLLCACTICSGQGSIDFGNGAGPASWIATNSGPGGASTGYIAAHSTGSAYYFGLFVAPTSFTQVSGLDPTASGFTFFGAIATNNALGRFYGNPTTDYLVVPGYPTLSSANFVIAGWSANVGTTWNEVQTWLHTGAPALGSVWYGISEVAMSVGLGGGQIPSTGLFGGNPWQIRGFTLNTYVTTIPEPSLAGLATLGAAGLLLSKRGRETTARCPVACAMSPLRGRQGSRKPQNSQTL